MRLGFPFYNPGSIQLLVVFNWRRTRWGGNTYQVSMPEYLIENSYCYFPMFYKSLWVKISVFFVIKDSGVSTIILSELQMVFTAFGAAAAGV